MDEGTLSPKKDDGEQKEEEDRGEKVPLNGVEGAGAEEAPKDSSLLTAGD